MAVFDIKDLSFTYPAKEKRALSGIDLTIQRGEYITLCGRSGCGKTTLLRHLKSVLTPHGKREGEIFFEGTPLEKVSLRDQSSMIGYVMQDPDSQIVTDKVWHELAFGLESLGCDQRTMRLRVAEMASYFGIQGWFHRDVSELSGGQKQLLNLASIMAMQPSVLILDEPTSQLDPIAASDFLNTVRKINLELGTTIIMTEHRLEDILHASDRVVVMEEGRILTTGSPREIGDELRRKGNDMFSAMPSPVQIFYAVGGKGDCPLTVREGRTFLSEEFAGKEISIDSVKEEEPFDGEIAGPALEVKEVWFRYEKDLPDVLKGVSLSVPKGSLFAIVGGNGTGKSTLLRCISSALVPYRGDIKVFGKSLKKYKTSELFKGNLSMLPQDPKCLFVKKTVKEDLYEMLPAGDKQKDEKVKEVSEICDIERLLSSHPYDLSGGEQQRAALAKVLLTEPLLLLLDEPTKGMDSFFKIRFAGILDDLKKRGVTVVMVSHDIEFCAKYADLVSMFFDGGVVTTNTPNRFFSQNSFYTTAANRMSRHVFRNAVNSDDVITLYKENMKI